MRCVRRRQGFTLLEVLVALSIGALVLVSARGLLEALGDHAVAVLLAARNADARANADDLLRRAVADLVIRSDTLPSFEGDEATFAFRSSCEQALGWREPCDVQVRAERADDGVRVTLVEAGDSVVMRRGVKSVAIRYLLSTDDGGKWTTDWHNTLMLPLAVGIVAGEDTTLVRVGER